MARKTPRVENTRLLWFDPDLNLDNYVLDIVEDWQHWQAWLEQDLHRTFRFIAADGKSCSLFKEKRTSYGRTDKLFDAWYAHKKVRGVLRKIYVGKAGNVTHRKLTQITNDLNMSEGWWQRRKDQAKKG